MMPYKFSYYYHYFLPQYRVLGEEKYILLRKEKFKLSRNAGPSPFQLQETMLKSDKI